MTESEFLALAHRVLDVIETQVDGWNDHNDTDIEAERNGNVLTLVFENGAHVVVNSQAPMQELWVAARSGGFHYRLADGKWHDTRSGDDLATALASICSAEAGQALSLTVPVA